MVVLGALPSFENSALIVAPDVRQVSQTDVLAGNAAGILLVERRLGRSFWFPSPFDEPLVLLGPAVDSVHPLQDRFVGLMGGTASLLTTTGSSQTLLDGGVEFSFVRSTSTSEVWFFDSNSVWVTDGTVGGTRRVLQRGFPSGTTVFEAGGQLGALTAPGVFSILAAGAQTATEFQATSASTVGSHFLLGGSSLRNELGEVLLAEPCEAIPGGGWAKCGGRFIATNGTTGDVRVVASDGGTHLIANESTLIRASPLSAVDSHGVVTDLFGACEGPSLLSRDFLICRNMATPLDGRRPQLVHNSFLAPNLGPSAASGDVVVARLDGWSHDILWLWNGSDPPRQLSPWWLTVNYPADQPTVSSQLTLLDSNDDVALYESAYPRPNVDASQRGFVQLKGLWLTNGTSAFRIGGTGELWGTGVISGTRMVRADGTTEPAPSGLVGVSGRLAFFHENCTVTTVDATDGPKMLDVGGCVTGLVTFRDAALIQRMDGRSMLVRAGFDPIDLGPDVHTAFEPRCGPGRCWFASGGSVQSAELASGGLSAPTMPAVGPEWMSLAGSDDVLVVSRPSSAGAIEVMVIRLGTSPQSVIVPGGTVAVAVTSTREVLVASSSLVVVAESGVTTTQWPCSAGLVRAQGPRAWAACPGQSALRLISMVGGVPTLRLELSGNARATGLAVNDTMAFFTTTQAQLQRLTIMDDTDMMTIPDATAVAVLRSRVVFSKVGPRGHELRSAPLPVAVPPVTEPPQPEPPAKPKKCETTASGALAVLSLWAVVRRRERNRG